MPLGQATLLVSNQTLASFAALNLKMLQIAKWLAATISCR